MEVNELNKVENLKELENAVKRDLKELEIETEVSVYEFLIESYEGYYLEYNYEDLSEEEYDKISDYAKDFEKKYKIKYKESYNEGGWGDPYYTTNLIFSVGDDFYVRADYFYQSYDGSEYNGGAEQVKLVQVIKNKWQAEK